MTSAFFVIARALAWGSAISKGPGAVARRAGRKVVYKAVGRGLRRF